jgi:hypothetical protein
MDTGLPGCSKPDRGSQVDEDHFLSLMVKDLHNSTFQISNTDRHERSLIVERHYSYCSFDAGILILLPEFTEGVAGNRFFSQRAVAVRDVKVEP